MHNVLVSESNVASCLRKPFSALLFIGSIRAWTRPSLKLWEKWSRLILTRKCQEILACSYKHQGLVMGGLIVCPSPSSGKGMQREILKLMGSFTFKHSRPRFSQQNTCDLKEEANTFLSVALKKKIGWKQSTPHVLLRSEALPALGCESDSNMLSAVCCDLRLGSLRTEVVYFAPAATPKESVFH